MSYPGLRLQVVCNGCGASVLIDVERTAPVHLPRPGDPPVERTIDYECDGCGRSGAIDVILHVPG